MMERYSAVIFIEFWQRNLKESDVMEDQDGDGRLTESYGGICFNSVYSDGSEESQSVQ
jgi:hypothetical protein